MWEEKGEKGEKKGKDKDPKTVFPERVGNPIFFVAIVINWVIWEAGAQPGLPGSVSLSRPFPASLPADFGQNPGVLEVGEVKLGSTRIFRELFPCGLQGFSFASFFPLSLGN